MIGLGRETIARMDALSSLLLRSLISRMSTKISLYVSNDIQALVFDGILDADWLSLTAYSSGELTSRFNTDVTTVASNAISWLPNLIIGGYTFAATFLVIFHYDRVMALLALASAPFLLLSSSYLIKRMRGHNQRMKEAGSALMGYEVEAFSNLDTIKSFGLMDTCAQGLRQIRIGLGAGPLNGFEMDSGFYITVASEVMAILAVASDLADLRRRIGRIVVAYSKSGTPITADDLEVAGAMTAWMVRALNPTLMQTVEGQPVLVHAGPFANIAIGQNSVIADRVACALADYAVTESGFASDMGYEKFWNIKCRCSGLRPDAVVLVATVRALKRHGGGPDVKPGTPLDPAYTQENLGLLEAGCRSNLLAHIDIIRRSGIRPVVCLNHFYTDTDAEVALVRKVVEEAGCRFALSKHWEKGGEGAEELARQVIAACEEPNDFAYLCDLDEEPLSVRLDKQVREVYGGDGVDYEPAALAKLRAYEADPDTAHLPLCVAKTQYSLSDDAARIGRPTGWRLKVQDVLLYQGAGFVVPVSGKIQLMPGTSANPAYRRIDVDVETGKVRGLF